MRSLLRRFWVLPFPRVLVRKLGQLWILGIIVSAIYIYRPVQQLKTNNIRELNVGEHESYEAVFITAGKSSQFPEEWEKSQREPYFNLTLGGDENSPGQYGAAVEFTKEQADNIKKDIELNGFNTVASNMIALDRRMQDLRNEDCKNVVYDQDLPSASVIIIMYNEEPSLVLRTITSVLNASPRKHLKEIILVDDHSDRSSTDALPKAIEYLFPPIVKLFRNRNQLGLVKSRIVGADRATGDVLAFLDAHCEVGPGWLEPYLQRIKQDFRNVVIPMHDTIDLEKFNIYGATVLTDNTDFDWSLAQVWKGGLSQQEKLLLSESNASFVPSATMPGCCFGIDKRWWEELGKYDTGLAVWGGENLEISFKIWMCGGRMDMSPCSHQAHVYQTVKPRYHLKTNYMNANQKRLADVWMDNFKDIVYERQPEIKSIDVGDLSERIALRKRLKCHSFEWYLKKVLPDKYIPTTRTKAKNGLKNAAGQCMDTMQQRPPTAPKMYHFCHKGTTQSFDFSDRHEIRAALENCLEANLSEMSVSLVDCSGRDSQKWIHIGSNTPIRTSIDDKYCLTYNENDLKLVECDFFNQKHQWKFNKYS